MQFDKDVAFHKPRVPIRMTINILWMRRLGEQYILLPLLQTRKMNELRTALKCRENCMNWREQNIVKHTKRLRLATAPCTHTVTPSLRQCGRICIRARPRHQWNEWWLIVAFRTPAKRKYKPQQRRLSQRLQLHRQRPFSSLDCELHQLRRNWHAIKNKYKCEVKWARNFHKRSNEYLHKILKRNTH